MAAEIGGGAPQAERSWAFITNHARVLLAIASDPDARVQDLAATVQLTDRAVYRILADLQQAGFVSREKHGRRNRYLLEKHLPLGDPVVGGELVGYLLGAVRRETAAAALPDRP